MIKSLLSFFLLFAIFFMGIEIFRKMTGKEKWDVVKTVSYSLFISVLVIVCLTILVVLF
jgi:hypothetical protein